MSAYDLGRKNGPKVMIIGLIGVIVGVVMSLNMACPAALAQNLNGVYQVEGLDDGYRGTLTMSFAGGTYLLEWRLTSG